MTQTRRLAAILAADMAGYSRLIGVDEGGTLQAFKAIRDELFDPTIAAHDGRLVKTTGDGFLAEFSSVVDALRCATELQAGMAERNATIPTDKRIEFRIGINVGDVVVGPELFKRRHCPGLKPGNCPPPQRSRRSALEASTEFFYRIKKRAADLGWRSHGPDCSHGGALGDVKRAGNLAHFGVGDVPASTARLGKERAADHSRGKKNPPGARAASSAGLVPRQTS
jgi:hypothetical protein